jgi:exosome complex RNA-binding protein Rrp4
VHVARWPTLNPDSRTTTAAQQPTTQPPNHAIGQSANRPIAQALGAAVPFEVAIGSNGAVWLKGKTPATTVLLANALLNSLTLSEAATEAMVKVLVERMRKDEEERKERRR